MKKKISIIMTLVLSLFLIAGCGKTVTPTKAAEDYFSGIKTGTNNTFAKGVLKQQMQDKDVSPEASTATLDMLAKMESEVLGETIDGDNATVELKVNGVSFKTVLNDFLTKIFQNPKLLMGLSEEEANKKAEELIIQCLKEAKVEERTGKINLTKKDGKWVVSEDEALQGLVLGVTNEELNKLAK